MSTAAGRPEVLAPRGERARSDARGDHTSAAAEVPLQPHAHREAPALELKGVGKTYGSVAALAATDLTVGQGELVTLLGPSGSGKSTILGIAAGIIAPDVGRVIFNGRDVTDRPAHERDVGMVFQRYTLFPNMTVAENVAFPLRARSVAAGRNRGTRQALPEPCGLARAKRSLSVPDLGRPGATRGARARTRVRSRSAADGRAAGCARPPAAAVAAGGNPPHSRRNESPDAVRDA
jgi:ABC-type sugar transport system ATPase subunit